MDDLFGISVHHGGYFTKNPKKYMRDEVDVGSVWIGLILLKLKTYC